MRTPRSPVVQLISYSVGGDTEDRLSWSEDVDGVNNIFPAVPDVITATKQLFPEASHGKIGGDWFYLSRNLPEGTAIIWGVNFAAKSVTEALTQVREIQKAFQISRGLLKEPHQILTSINRMRVFNQ